MKTKYTKEYIIEKTKEIMKNNNFSFNEFVNYCKDKKIFSFDSIYRYLKGCKNLEFQSGVKFRKTYIRKIPLDKIKKRGHKYTKEYIITTAKNIIKDNNFTYSKFLMYCRKNHLFSETALQRMFGSGSNFRLESNIKFRKRGELKYTKEYLIETIKNIMKNNDFSFREFIDYIYDYKLFSIDTIKKNFKNRKNLELVAEIKFRIGKIKKDVIKNNLNSFFRDYKYPIKSDLIKYNQQNKICCLGNILLVYESLEKIEQEFKKKFFIRKEAKKLKAKDNFINIFSGFKFIYKKDILYNCKLGKCETFSYLKKNFNINNLAKSIGAVFIEHKYPRKKINVGFHEREILDFIEKQNNIKLKRYFPIGSFYVDGYDMDNNVVYEVDEPHHKYRKEHDVKRENIIKGIIRCRFVRLDEIEYLDKIIGGNLNDFNYQRGSSCANIMV